MPRADPGPRRAASKRASSGLLLGLLLGVLTLFAYLPATAAGFVWDDDLYLTQNPCLRDWRGLARLWIPGNTVQYYPAVFTTFWVEQRVFGLEPRATTSSTSCCTP
jgi:hypothetical protein